MNDLMNQRRVGFLHYGQVSVILWNSFQCLIIVYTIGNKKKRGEQR